MTLSKYELDARAGCSGGEGCVLSAVDAGAAGGDVAAATEGMAECEAAERALAAAICSAEAPEECAAPRYCAAAGSAGCEAAVSFATLLHYHASRECGARVE